MRVGEKNIQKKRSLRSLLGQTEATKCSGNHMFGQPPRGEKRAQIPAGKYCLSHTTILYKSD